MRASLRGCAWLLFLGGVLLACVDEDEPTLSAACTEACEDMKTCDEAAEKVLDGDYLDSCITSCGAGMDITPAPSASQIQTCVDEHLSTCDEAGFVSCLMPEYVKAAMDLFKPLCEKSFECCGTPSSENQIQTVEQCTGLFVGLMMMLTDSAMSAGYLEIDTASLRTCSDAAESFVADTSCNEFDLKSLHSADLGFLGCNDFIIGHQEEGETCSYVDPENFDGMISSSDAYCIEGLVCSWVEDEDDKWCVEGLAAGAECEGMFRGAKCDKGLVCGPNDTCIEPQADGAVCSADNHCDSRECTAFGIEGECVPKNSDACENW